MRRHGFDSTTIENIHEAYRLIYQSGQPLADAMAQIEESLPQTKEIQYILSFINNSRRGFIH
jgi:UDP-N-acetylglucosamine acyltransferase